MLSFRFLGSLQWKLTLSYMFITVGTILFLEVLFLWLLGGVSFIQQDVSGMLRYIIMGITLMVGSGAALTLATIPFGLLFGFITSRILFTGRLQGLAFVAESYSHGDFSLKPADRSADELGQLGTKLLIMGEQLETLLETRQALASVEERNRLARDLHDTVKQQLFAMQMQLGAAQALLEYNPAAAGTHLQQADALSRQTQQELKTLIDELRPAALESRGLADSVRDYAKVWGDRTGIQVEVGISGERQIPLAQEQSLYRILQEALANVDKHSTASRVAVQLSYTKTSVALIIQDNGVGFDTTVRSQGFGLQSMRQRAEEMGGILNLQSTPQGTMVEVRIAPQ